jgi:hypothetical protein
MDDLDIRYLVFTLPYILNNVTTVYLLNTGPAQRLPTWVRMNNYLVGHISQK